MLTELGITKITRLVQRREKEQAKEQELHTVKLIEKYSVAEGAFIAMRTAIFSRNLDPERIVYHTANGFAFKIHPVEFHDNGTRTYLIDRKNRFDDLNVIDTLEITRNPQNFKDATLTDCTVRKSVVGDNGISFVISRERAKIETFLSLMTPPQEPEA